MKKKIILKLLAIIIFAISMTFLNENQNYIKDTKRNETLFKSGAVCEIDKNIIGFTSRYRCA